VANQAEIATKVTLNPIHKGDAIHRGDAQVNELPETLVCEYISCIVVVFFFTVVVLFSFQSCSVLISHSLVVVSHQVYTWCSKGLNGGEYEKENGKNKI
jgi:hypothetical protein